MTEQPRKLAYNDPFAETEETKAAQYVASGKLLDAVEVALALGMPLLLTGEPGTGKTQLAHYLARTLHIDRPDRFPSSKLEVFHTKSTSVHTDLFYQYEALLHFRESRGEGAAPKPTSDYIRLEPLGLAIRQARDRGHRTVVLIDEVDKAPRDFPNDILNEIEEMKFKVKETGEEYVAHDQSLKPVLVFTSNQERDLPDAFRRRCVFFHIKFEDLDKARIIQSRLGLEPSSHQEIVTAAFNRFNEIREMKTKLDKLPAMAELINWMRYLVLKGIDVSKPESQSLLAVSYSLLAKSDADLKALKSESPRK